MSQMRSGVRLASALALVCVLLQAAVGQALAATNITSSGLGTALNGSCGGGGICNITGGDRRGPNLFHSFGSFSIGAGDTANFINDSGLASSNILGRVTGGQTSNIFGTIQTTNTINPAGVVNVFLINPAGWIFGPTASLNVAGSFHVSTADYVRFPDVGGAQVRFTADASPLPANGLAVDPIAFGFLSSNPTRISITGSSLQVPTDMTLSIVGGEAPFAGQSETGLRIAGPSTVATPTLAAPGGRIQIVSVASPGEVTLNPDVSSFSQLGRIDVSNGARIDVSGVNGPGGTVVIRGGQFFASQSSRILANTTGSANGAATAVDIQVSGDMTLAGGSGIDVRTSAAGASGETNITAGTLGMREGSFIQSITSNGAAGGAISVNVETATLQSASSISTLSDRVVRFPPAVITDGGPGGDVTLTATGSVIIDGANSGLTSTTLSQLAGGAGTGGRLSISAASLTLDNAARVRTTSSGTGPSGNLLLEVGKVSLANGGNLRGSTINARGGDVTVTVTGSATISGTDSAGNPSGIFSGSRGTGSVGPISVSAGRLTLTGGVIQSGTSLDPGGGNVTAIATDSIRISDGGGISSQARSQDVGQVTVSAPSVTIDNGFLSTSTIGLGAAGPLNVGTAEQPVQTLTLANGGQITSSSELTASGNGGSVTVIAADSVSISGKIPDDFVFGPSDVRQLNPDPNSGIFSTAQSTGDAGQILLTTPTLSLGDDGKISVATSGDGRAGDIGLKVANFTLTTNARVDSGTTGAGQGGTVTLNATGLGAISTGAGLFSNAEGSGAGGDLNIRVGQLQLLDGAIISAESTGTETALAGNVNIVAGSLLRMLNSTITTESTVADGGNINIQTTGSTMRLTNSQITTSVQSGVGQGGNIMIGSTGNPFEFILLDRSQIRADAFGGPGGNINMFANVYLTSASVVSASSALSTPGTIAIEATVSDVSGSLTQLPTTPLEAAALVRASCAARLAGGKTSSLVLAGREGLPLEPSGLLPSPLVVDAPVAALAPDEELPWVRNLLWVSYLSLDPNCMR